jgi:hypothetical protein
VRLTDLIMMSTPIFSYRYAHDVAGVHAPFRYWRGFFVALSTVRPV